MFVESHVKKRLVSVKWLAYVLLCSVFFPIATHVVAQSPRFLDRVFQASDSDGDGKISKREANKSRFPFLSPNFAELDKDSSGTLDRAELGKFSFPPKADSLVEAVVTAVKRTNYSRSEIDDKTSARLHKLFIRNLDPMKLYFLQSDIDEFQQHAKEHDDMLKREDVSLAETIARRYRERSDERMQWAQTFSDAEFDFEKPDVRPAVPEACQLAVDAEQAKERWRKEVKFRLVQLINAGMSIDEARAATKQEYRRLAEKRDDLSATNLYLNTLAKSMDPHSSFAPPQLAANQNVHMSQSLVGIGALLRNKDGQIELVSLLPGGPAEESGKLAPGDQIVAVGQGQKGEMANVSGQPMRDVVALIRGDSGTTVRLTIQREDGSVATIPLVRRKVDLLGVQHQMISQGTTEASALRVGLIRIPSFYGSRERSVTADTRNALRELVGQSADAILIDLRNNSGGLADEAVAIAGLFIDGPVMQSKNSRGIVRVRDDDDDGVLFSGPLAILTNRRSASASEIVSMAIQDYQRGIVIGDSQTYGKGSAATRMNIANLLGRRGENLGTLDVTVSKFYGPTGRSTLLSGLKADVALPSLTDDPGIGEASELHTLARDSIEDSDFKPTGDVTPELVRELVGRSESRRQKSDEFARLRQAKKTWLALQARKTIEFSTKSSGKASEAKRLLKLRGELAGSTRGKDFGSNAYEAEVIHIVHDLIELTRPSTETE